MSPELSIFPTEKTVEEGSYETRDTEITFECSEKPKLSWEPVDAKVQSTWDPKKKLLKVILPHDKGAVSLTLEKADQ